MNVWNKFNITYNKIGWILWCVVRLNLICRQHNKALVHILALVVEKGNQKLYPNIIRMTDLVLLVTNVTIGTKNNASYHLVRI